MRVLHVYRTFFPETQGGVEEAIRQICLNSSRHGVQSRVFTLAEISTADTVCWDGIDVYRFPRLVDLASCGISLSALPAFREQCQWADIIHYHFPWPFADLLHFLGCLNKTTILTYHSDIVRQKWLRLLYRPLMDRFLKGMFKLVATSPGYKISSPELRRYSDRVAVIPMGIDPNSYPLVDPQIMERLRQQVGEGFFLFIGVLRYYKGLQFLLKAAQGFPGRIVIAGSGPEGEKLKRQARDNGLEQVQFLGQVTDQEKVALFSLARAVVLPSHFRSEAFGVCLLEGAMYGKPLISTALETGTDFINKHKVTGLVVPPADSHALRQAMDTFFFDPEMAARMGGAAKQRFLTLFTGDIMGLAYTTLYATCLQSSSLRVSKN